MSKLQAVLNACAKLITGLRRFNHITPALQDELHYLPSEHRITFKIALLVYKRLHGIIPLYFADYCITLSAANLGHHLRSTARGILHQPWTRMQRFGPRSFCSSGPAVWNSLPPAVKDTLLTISQLKKRLKFNLFRLACNIN